MPTIGYCHDCGLWVHVRPDRSCPSGHAAARVNGWYDSETGQDVAAVVQPAAPPRGSVTTVAADALNGTPAAFLNDLMSTLSQNHAYCAGWGQDTDMVIASNPVDASWGAGESRAEYKAVLKAVEADRTVHFWELLTGRNGSASADGFESESDPAGPVKDSEPGRDVAIGPGSAPWDWGYGTLRQVVEEVAARHGFGVRVELDRQVAVW